MARPIDYSKWDHIDTDSEDDVPSPSIPKPTPPKPPPSSSPSKPSQVPRKAVTTSSDDGASLGLIQCLYMPCKGENVCPITGPEFLHPDDPIFTKGTLSPLSSLIGLPLRFLRVDKRPSLSIPRTAKLDNQPVTYMMIDPVTGFAHPEWQQGIGSVFVARQDKRPLLIAHLEAVWQFADDILERFGDGNVNYKVDMTKKEFLKFFKWYKDRQVMNHHDPHVWTESTPGPFDV
mmetsp:Transcript_52587/g.87410  ORF Transcript_52587/g.87410 Transcript_52587/m.87410 type:complete len:232 (+) Transcript_52587:92-787(+)